MNRTTLGVLGAVPLLVGGLALTTNPAVAAPADGSTATYIVQMRDLPTASYDGSIAGYKATKAGAGKKFDSTTADAVKYAGYLTAQHDAVIAKVGGAKKLYDYKFTFNGFSAKLTAAQVAKLNKQPGVVAVTAQEMVKEDTSSTPSFLGLNDAA